MDGFLTFLAGFISWNTLVWVIVAVSGVGAARLVARFTDRNLHEMGKLVHFVAFAIAGIGLVIAWGSDYTMDLTSSDRWINIIIAQFTAQSIFINGPALLAHILFSAKAGSDKED